MIVPSIDLQNGRAVQLRRGREHALDGGDPFDRLEEFAVAGEVAIVDLDAAMGQGSNAAIIKELIVRAPCRVGGGIRSLDAALEWLDAGAAKIVVGTAATPDFCAALPRDRVIAAVDAERGEVVVEGWRTRTGRDVLGAVEQLAPHVGGFLLTQVEHEGMMGGFDRGLVERVARAAGSARVTAAGGITTAAEVAELDAMGVDAQVGMALYTGKLPLADALAAPLVEPASGLWPTVVCDEEGRALGLVWSNRPSLARAVAQRRGVYWSRSRNALWVKGETSGNAQDLLRVDLDCDRDALRFVVRQHGSGFCHRETRSCWGGGDDFDLGALERLIAARARDAAPGSGTAKLLRDPELLRSKLLEEAAELAEARRPGEAIREAADLLYFLLVGLEARGGSLADVRRELERRNRRVRRRPMAAKPERGS